MGSETKPSNGGGGFRAKTEHYLYSGDKKHVFAGIAIITAVFAVPWFLMNRDTIYSIGYIPRCTFPLAVFQVHSLAAGQNINPIKITWKKPTKPGVKDFLQHPLHLND